MARRGSEAGLFCRHRRGGGDEPIVHPLLLCACAHPEQHGLGAQPAALSRAAGAAVPAGAWRRGAGLRWEQSPSRGSSSSLGSAGCRAPRSPASASCTPGSCFAQRWAGTAAGAWPVQTQPRAPPEPPLQLVPGAARCHGCDRAPRSPPGPALPPPSASIPIRLLSALARALPGVVCAACCCCCAPAPRGCLALLAPQRPLLACVCPRGPGLAVPQPGGAQHASLCSQEAG